MTIEHSSVLFFGNTKTKKLDKDEPKELFQSNSVVLWKKAKQNCINIELALPSRQNHLEGNDSTHMNLEQER